MARIKINQQNATSAQDEAERAALQLDRESDVYRSEEDAGLSAVQWQAVALLVAGKRAVDVAQQLDVTQETVSRWRSNPVFAAAVNAGIRESYAAIVGEVRDASTDAVHVLRETMQRSEDERLRLQAALATLRLRVQLDATALTAPATPADIARETLRQRKLANLDSLMVQLA